MTGRMRTAVGALALAGMAWATAGMAAAQDRPTPVVRPAPERCATAEPLWSDDVTGELDAALRCTAHLGLMDGSRDGRFHPEFAVSRADAVRAIVGVLRATGLHLPESVPDVFDDDGESGAEPEANVLAAIGVLQGTAARRLDPRANVSRGQLASLAVRAAMYGSRAVDASVDFFADDDASVHAAAIDQAAAGGIIAGFGGGEFRPAWDASRGQVALVAVRLVSWLEDPTAIVPPD